MFPYTRSVFARPSVVADCRLQVHAVSTGSDELDVRRPVHDKVHTTSITGSHRIFTTTGRERRRNFRIACRRNAGKKRVQRIALECEKRQTDPRTVPERMDDVT